MPAVVAAAAKRSNDVATAALLARSQALRCTASAPNKAHQQTAL